MKKVIGKIREQGKAYKPHTNQWNVMNQLIDLVAADPAAAELVEKDLDIPEMGVPKIVAEITGKRMADPAEVMKALCNFYGLAVPEELPPEYWRHEMAERTERTARTEKAARPQKAAEPAPKPQSKVVSFMELLGGAEE